MGIFSKICLALLTTAALSYGDRLGDINQYGACVAQTRELLVRYHRAIPLPLLAADRKLIRMAEGVEVMIENYNVLRGELERAPQDVLKQIAVSNATEACGLFRSQFQARAQKLAIMLIAIAGFLLTFALRIGFGFIGRFAAKPAKAEPQDQPSASRTSL